MLSGLPKASASSVARLTIVYGLFSTVDEGKKIHPPFMLNE